MDDLARNLLLALLVALGATGCGDDVVMDPPGPCASLKPTMLDDTKVEFAIATHVPVSLTVYCADKVRFGWEGGTVDIIYIAYGAPPTLPSPPTFVPNTVCALDNGNGVSFLFDAVWSNNEPPLTITAECPAIALNATGDTALQCTSPPLFARTHPVLADQGFRRFFEANPLPTQIAVCGRNLPPGEP